ncbi:MAG: hypothetical protein JXR94_00665 [Candidatus Hydrogenedentes bacterium]|nr:hypothetical protein [Candidatus Hydrogenedentota bacterium]
MPEADEEIDDDSCPSFNFNTDPFVWIRAPATPGTISITVSRAGNDTHPDGVPGSASGEVSVLDSRVARNRRFFSTQIDMEDIIKEHLLYTNIALTADDDGAYRQYDSNGDGEVADPDEYRDGYDSSVCVKYDIQSYDDPASISPTPFMCCWAGTEVAWTNGGTLVVEPADFVFGGGSADWERFRKQSDYDVLYVRYALEVLDPYAQPRPIVRNRGGGGECVLNRTVIGVQGYVQGTLIHELGHNTGTSTWGDGLGHVSLTASGTEYSRNVMGNTTADRKWISRIPLTTDEEIWCNAPAPPGKQAQYDAFLHED